MLGIGLVAMVVGLVGAAQGNRWMGALMGGSGGFIGAGIRAIRGSAPLRPRQAVPVIGVAVAGLALLFLYLNGLDDDGSSFAGSEPATAPVVVAEGPTPDGGSWMLEAYFNREHELCTRHRHVGVPVVSESGAGKSGVAGGSGCSDDLPLSLSGSSDDTTRLVFGTARLDATTARLVMCDGSTRSVAPKANGEFGRSFFGFAVPKGTARSVVLVGPGERELAREELTEVRSVGTGDKRHLAEISACQKTG
ncbi:MAG: hypothetical protein QOI61_1571 [Actinomycetota bacterium]|jgi:hypothetical protein